jgi:hypothetical protein
MVAWLKSLQLVSLGKEIWSRITLNQAVLDFLNPESLSFNLPGPR